MREIKFRAWHGKLERMIDLKGSVFGECGFYWTDENGKQWECEWDTVMQYTGLKDKNGKEIYELMEINNKYKVIYKAPNYVLNDISSGDILTFKEIIKNENEIEITKEYTEL